MEILNQITLTHMMQHNNYPSPSQKKDRKIEKKKRNHYHGEQCRASIIKASVRS